jgi:hypothetical protein
MKPIEAVQLGATAAARHRRRALKMKEVWSIRAALMSARDRQHRQTTAISNFTVQPLLAGFGRWIRARRIDAQQCHATDAASELAVPSSLRSSAAADGKR